MEKVLKDQKFQQLLKNKQRLEMLSMTIPFISIIALLVFLYLFSQSLLIPSIIVLSFVLLLIVGQYVFDSKIANKIDHTYLELNKYFQDKIVPQLLRKNNSSIIFDNEKNVDISIIDAVDLFNVFKRYNSRFHYEGIINNRRVTFDELIFDGAVDYNTSGLKELDKQIEDKVNYHIYSVELERKFNGEALFVLNGFEELNTEDILSFSKVDLGNRVLKLKDDLDFSFYLKDPKTRVAFMKDKILNLFREKEFTHNSLIIYVIDNRLHVIIEEFESLINTPHSKRFTIEKLMFEYKEEQKLIEKIIQAFEL